MSIPMLFAVVSIATKAKALILCVGISIISMLIGFYCGGEWVCRQCRSYPCKREQKLRKAEEEAEEVSE